MHTVNIAGTPIVPTLPVSIQPIALERWHSWDQRMRKAGFRYDDRARHIRFVARFRGANAERLALPHDDHPRAWRRANLGIVRVSHVYEHAHGPHAQEEIRAFCREHRLAVAFSHELDWYYPGRTMLVVVGSDDALAAIGLAAS